MKRLFLLPMLALTISVQAVAEDHVMAATKGTTRTNAPESLTLSIDEAQDYAVKANRSLRNAELAVQQAYAQRWQTIAAMLPQVDASWGFNSMCGYKMEMAGMTIDMPNYSTLGVTASVGINGQAVVGAILNNIAIDMQKISLEQSEDNLRANVKTSYASVLVLQEVVSLLDSSLTNVERLAEMTQRSVDVGAAEQTSADQIVVRVNTLKNNINSNKRSIQLGINTLKVLLDVPVETELTLSSTLDDMLSGDEVLRLLGQEFLIEKNLNYQTLEKNVDLAKANVHMAGWAYGPTVGVGYQYSNQHYYDDGGFRMTPPNAVSVTISMPLWSSGKRAAGVVEKKIALETARNTLAETSDNLAIQNEQLRYNLQNAFETYLTEKENMDVTQRVFQSTTNKYNYGAASNLELVNASNDVISAQSTYVQAVLTLVNAEVELDKFLNN
jgi:outer membrane protein TolC